jgi:hydroxymethylbilane synthase
LDGKQKIDIKKEVKLSNAKDLGKTSAEEVLQKGGDKLMQEIRNENSTVH